MTKFKCPNCGSNDIKVSNFNEQFMESIKKADEEIRKIGRELSESFKKL